MKMPNGDSMLYYSPGLPAGQTRYVYIDFYNIGIQDTLHMIHIWDKPVINYIVTDSIKDNQYNDPVLFNISVADTLDVLNVVYQDVWNPLINDTIDALEFEFNATGYGYQSKQFIVSNPYDADTFIVGYVVTAIEPLDTHIVYGGHGYVTIKNKYAPFKIWRLNGQLYKVGTTKSDNYNIVLPQGIWVVSVNNKNYKVAVK